MAKLNLPEDKDLAKSVVESEADQANKRLDIGLIGLVLGSASEKPGNVAGLTACVSLCALLGILLYGQDSVGFTRREQALLFLGLLSSSLSYIFGENSAARSSAAKRR